MQCKRQRTWVTLERSRARPSPAVCGWVPAAGQSEPLRQRPRVAFPSLHTAAWCTTDRSAMVVTQHCFECHTNHWTTAFTSFLLSVMSRREEKMAFGCHTLRHSRCRLFCCWVRWHSIVFVMHGHCSCAKIMSVDITRFNTLLSVTDTQGSKSQEKLLKLNWNASSQQTFFRKIKYEWG